MLAQLLIGATEYEEREDNEFRQLFERNGYHVKVIQIDRAIHDKNSNYVTSSLSSIVDLTIINSGLRWMYLTRVPIENRLFPNTIVITGNPALQIAWTLKPIIVILRDVTCNEKLVAAAQILRAQPRRYPRWSGSYIRTDYGWLLRNVDEEPYALGAWQKLKVFIWPGYTISIWSMDPNITVHKFKVVSIADSCITMESVVDNSLKIINRDEFYEIASDWIEYKRGNIPDWVLEKITMHYLYVLGLLHWLDIEGRLNDLSEIR